jgi:hypothetical protein
MAEVILAIMVIVFQMMFGNSTAPPGAWSPAVQDGEVSKFYYLFPISSNIRME